MCVKKDSSRTSLARAIITALMLLAFLVFNVYAKVFSRTENVAPNSMYVKYLIAVIIFGLVGLPIDIPFDYYETFVIEERYGMNKTTKKNVLGRCYLKNNPRQLFFKKGGRKDRYAQDNTQDNTQDVEF